MLGVFFSVHFEIIDKLQRRRHKVNVNRIGKKTRIFWMIYDDETWEGEKFKSGKCCLGI